VRTSHSARRQCQPGGGSIFEIHLPGSHIDFGIRFCAGSMRFALQMPSFGPQPAPIAPQIDTKIKFFENLWNRPKMWLQVTDHKPVIFPRLYGTSMEQRWNRSKQSSRDLDQKYLIV
jgi:hypothetical protein